MAVEFGSLPRQQGADEFLGDLVEMANNPGRWAKVTGPLVKDPDVFARRWKRQNAFGISPDDFDAVSVNGDLWMRAKES